MELSALIRSSMTTIYQGIKHSIATSNVTKTGASIVGFLYCPILLANCLINSTHLYVYFYVHAAPACGRGSFID